jgi:uncharacterized protein (TIGR02453 family)
MSASPFTAKSLAFLRALKRHNDRDWFRERKAEYELHLREPMIEVLRRLSADFPDFAPEMISDPRVSLYRIYRDTRFSADKSPLKTNVAAHFPSRGFTKGEGAGMYFEISPEGVWIGGGVYMPSSSQLLLLREHIVANQRRFERLIAAPALRKAVGEIQGARLSRVPRGFASDHPAAEHLKRKQFLAGRDYPAEFAISPRFYTELLGVFKAITPFITFLNQALPRQSSRRVERRPDQTRQRDR